MTRWAIVVAVLVGFAGCQSDDDRDVAAACTNFCACETALPALHDTCMTACLRDAPTSPSSCLACLAQAACHELDDCFNACGLDD